MQALFALLNQPLAQRRKLFIVPDPALGDLGRFFFDEVTLPLNCVGSWGDSPMRNPSSLRQPRSTLPGRLGKERLNDLLQIVALTFRTQNFPGLMFLHGHDLGKFLSALATGVFVDGHTSSRLRLLFGRKIPRCAALSSRILLRPIRLLFSYYA